VSVRGISRPSRRLKRRLTTRAGDFSLEREIAPPRVQAGAESGKMHVGLCPRGDLNPESRAFSPILRLNTQIGEKSPVRGFHANMLTGVPRLVSSRLAARSPGATGAGTIPV
jgi:hypothetical protein